MKHIESRLIKFERFLLRTTPEELRELADKMEKARATRRIGETRTVDIWYGEGERVAIEFIDDGG